MGGIRRRHRRRTRRRLVDDDTEGDTAIDDCLCPCHIDGGLITDADLKAQLEAQCKCEAFAETLGITDPDDEADTAAYLETRDPFTSARRTSTDAERNCGESCPCGEPDC